jgi:hypothetical protein
MSVLQKSPGTEATRRSVEQSQGDWYVFSATPNGVLTCASFQQAADIFGVRREAKRHAALGSAHEPHLNPALIPPRARNPKRRRRCALPAHSKAWRQFTAFWETGANVIQPQRGCGATGENRGNAVGVEPITDTAPRVARAAQLWVLGRNPFGIRSSVDGHLKKMGAVWN